MKIKNQVVIQLAGILLITSFGVSCRTLPVLEDPSVNIAPSSSPDLVSEEGESAESPRDISTDEPATTTPGVTHTPSPSPSPSQLPTPTPSRSAAPSSSPSPKATQKPRTKSTPAPSPSPIAVIRHVYPGLVVEPLPSESKQDGFFAENDLGSRTLRFRYKGIRSECSRDGGVKFGDCDTGESLIWRLEDYNRRHVIRVISSTDDREEHRFVPSELQPDYRVLVCDQRVQSDETFAEFSLRLKTGGLNRARPKGICMADNVVIRNGGNDSWIQFAADHIFLIADGRVGPVFLGTRIFTNYSYYSLGMEAQRNPIYGVLDVSGRKGIGLIGIRMQTDSPHGVAIYGDDRSDLLLKDLNIETRGHMAYPLHIQQSTAGGGYEGWDAINDLKIRPTLGRIDIRSSKLTTTDAGVGARIEHTHLNVRSSQITSTWQGGGLSISGGGTFSISDSTITNSGGNVNGLELSAVTGSVDRSVIIDHSGPAGISMRRKANLEINDTRIVRGSLGWVPVYHWYGLGYAFHGDGTGEIVTSRKNGNLVCVESSDKYYYGILGKGITGSFDPLRQLNGPEGRIGVCP